MIMFPLIFNTIRNAQDRTFMERFYEQYHKLMYSQINKLTQNNDEIEEIMQEVWVRLIEKVSLLQTMPRDRLVNYSIAVARYTAYAFFRKKKRLELISFEDCELAWYSQQAADSRLEEIIIQKIEGEKLYYVWTHLNARDQALLNMKYILDYANNEIAEVLDVKPESVRMLLTRAKRKLSIGLSSDIYN